MVVDVRAYRIQAQLRAAQPLSHRRPPCHNGLQGVGAADGGVLRGKRDDYWIYLAGVVGRRCYSIAILQYLVAPLGALRRVLGLKLGVGGQGDRVRIGAEGAAPAHWRNGTREREGTWRSSAFGGE